MAYGSAALSAVIKESHVLREFRYVLDLLQNRGQLTYSRINVSPIIRGSGLNKTFHPNPEMQGLPDLMVWIKNGPFVCIEVKRPKGWRLSESQKSFRDRIRSMGHIYEVLSTFSELRELMARYNVII